MKRKRTLRGGLGPGYTSRVSMYFFTTSTLHPHSRSLITPARAHHPRSLALITSTRSHHPRSLARSQVTGASDPYAVLSVGPCTAQTSFVLNTVNPKWGQRLTLPVRSVDRDLLKVGTEPRGCFHPQSMTSIHGSYLQMHSHTFVTVQTVSVTLSAAARQVRVFCKDLSSMFTPHRPHSGPRVRQGPPQE